MRENTKIKGQLRFYLQWPVILSVFLMAANLVVGAISSKAGFAMSGFTLLYIVIAPVAVPVQEKTADGRTGGVFDRICMGAEAASL